MSGGRKSLAAALVVLALGLSLTATEAFADAYRPDGLIRRFSESQRDGDDIYNRDSVGQTRTTLVRREGRARFVVRVENDGDQVDDLVLAGTRNTEHYGIRYFVGAQEVSARIRAGVFRFRDVAAGAHRALTVEITAEPSAPLRSKVIARIAIRSGAMPTLLDRVKMVVYRSRGVETMIEGPSFTNIATAERWARSEDATARFVANAQLYWELAPPRGIRPEVAYAQSAKETGYGRFGGVIDASFNNPCGLKTTAGGDDDDPDAHMRFTTWRQGITACIDHLALYAGAPGYPRDDTPDPRHFPSVYATAPTVERLGGAWAPAADYGTSIVNDFLNPLLGS